MKKLVKGLLVKCGWQKTRGIPACEKVQTSLVWFNPKKPTTLDGIDVLLRRAQLIEDTRAAVALARIVSPEGSRLSREACTETTERVTLATGQSMVCRGYLAALRSDPSAQSRLRRALSPWRIGRWPFDW